MLQKYLETRIQEVERRLSILQNHWDAEMKFPFNLRRSSFLSFIYDEQKIYKSVLRELKNIKEIADK